MMVRLGHSTIMMSRFVSEGLKMFPEESLMGKSRKIPFNPRLFLENLENREKITKNATASLFLVGDHAEEL